MIRRVLLAAAVVLATSGAIVVLLRPGNELRVPWDRGLVLDSFPKVNLVDARAQFGLTVSVRDLPAHIPAVGDLRFTVRLTNPTAMDISLTPCPYYSLVVGESATTSGLSAYLPCGRISTIGAHHHRDMEVRLALDVYGGTNDLYWRLWYPASTDGPFDLVRLHVDG